MKKIISFLVNAVKKSLITDIGYRTLVTTLEHVLYFSKNKTGKDKSVYLVTRRNEDGSTSIQVFAEFAFAIFTLAKEHVHRFQQIWIYPNKISEETKIFKCTDWRGPGNFKNLFCDLNPDAYDEVRKITGLYIRCISAMSGESQTVTPCLSHPYSTIQNFVCTMYSTDKLQEIAGYKILAKVLKPRMMFDRHISTPAIDIFYEMVKTVFDGDKSFQNARSVFETFSNLLINYTVGYIGFIDDEYQYSTFHTVGRYRHEAFFTVLTEL